MKADLYLGVDIGTSVAKGVVIDDSGTPLTRASFVRQDSSQDLVKKEHNAEQVWWNEFLLVTNQLLGELKTSKENIKSVAVTAMVPNLLPIDARGRPLQNAILYYDGRATLIEEALDAETGTPYYLNHVLSQLIWLKTEMGSQWRLVDKILTTHNYIVFKLTDKICVDTITAGEFGNLLDSHKMEWNQELLERHGLNDSVFPRIITPTNIVGFVSERAAKNTGLPAGVPVLAGTTDMIGSFIGSGAWNRNDIMIYYGTYGCAPMLLDNLREAIFKERLNYPIEWRASIPRSGQQLSALAQVLFSSDSPQVALSKLDTMAAASSPGANGVVFVQILDLPRSTESTEPQGALFNLGRTSTMVDICRAILEAFGYGLRYRFETSSFGTAPKKCFAAGGGARSKIWRQIVSDIIGLEQSYSPYSSSAFGSAVLAAVAVDPEVWERVRELQTRTIETDPPHSENEGRYGPAYQQYKNYLERFTRTLSLAVADHTQ